MASPRIPPITALQALEPRPGGQWTVYEQEGDATSLSYVMDNGSEAITYTIHQCKTEEDIRKHCASFVYEYTDDVSEADYYHQSVHEVPTELVNPHVAAPLLYHTQEESTMRQYPTNQIQPQLQEQFLFSTEATIISPPDAQTQASIRFDERALAPQSHFYQQGQRHPMSNAQQLSQESFAGTSEWSLSNEMFPAAIGNTPLSILNNDIGITQDSTMFLGTWQQNWTHVDPNTTRSSDGDWDTFFSQY